MRRSVFILLMFWFDCKITIFFLKMARKRTFSHFFFEKKCVFVLKSLIWLQMLVVKVGCVVMTRSTFFSMLGMSLF